MIGNKTCGTCKFYKPQYDSDGMVGTCDKTGCGVKHSITCSLYHAHPYPTRGDQIRQMCDAELAHLTVYMDTDDWYRTTLIRRDMYSSYEEAYSAAVDRLKGLRV